mgnify:CR=1 FL=1
MGYCGLCGRSENEKKYVTLDDGTKVLCVKCCNNDDFDLKNPPTYKIIEKRIDAYNRIKDTFNSNPDAFQTHALKKYIKKDGGLRLYTSDSNDVFELMLHHLNPKFRFVIKEKDEIGITYYTEQKNGDIVKPLTKKEIEKIRKRRASAIDRDMFNNFIH